MKWKYIQWIYTQIKVGKCLGQLLPNLNGLYNKG